MRPRKRAPVIRITREEVMQALELARQQVGRRAWYQYSGEPEVLIPYGELVRELEGMLGEDKASHRWLPSVPVAFAFKAAAPTWPLSVRVHNYIPAKRQWDSQGGVPADAPAPRAPVASKTESDLSKTERLLLERYRSREPLARGQKTMVTRLLRALGDLSPDESADWSDYPRA